MVQLEKMNGGLLWKINADVDASTDRQYFLQLSGHWAAMPSIAL